MKSRKELRREEGGKQGVMLGNEHAGDRQLHHLLGVDLASGILGAGLQEPYDEWRGTVGGAFRLPLRRLWPVPHLFPRWCPQGLSAAWMREDHWDDVLGHETSPTKAPPPPHTSRILVITK